MKSSSKNILKKSSWKEYGRISIFIDAANIFYSQKSLKWTIDFKKFIPFFKNVSVELSDVFFYFALWHQKGKKRKNEEKMITMLKRNGFKVVVKDTKRVGGSIKGNCDVELAMDAIRMMSTYDTMVLFSGDGDFAALCSYMREHGKKVIIVSYRNHVSYELINNSDLYLSLDKFEKPLRYRKTT